MTPFPGDIHSQVDRRQIGRLLRSMLLPRNFRLLAGIAIALLLGTSLSRAERGIILDNGAFFSDSAKAEANRQLLDVGLRFKKEVVIETFKTIPDDVTKGVNLQDRAAVNRMFEQWTIRQARQQRVNGIYILLSKEPSHLQVIIGDGTQQTLFTSKDRTVLVDVMLARLRTKQYDEALLQGVNVIASAMKSHVVAHSRPAVQNRATTATEDSNPWGWVIAAVLGFLAAWLVVGIIRSIFSGGGAAGGTAAAPGSGGGFMSSLLGGMFGAAAGMWLYDQFSGHHGSDIDRGGFDDSSSSRRDSDYSSSGDSFSDDSNGGDVGGGDSGGGDSGGGDF